MKKVIITALASLLLSATTNASVIFYQEGFSNDLYSFDTDTNTETLVGDLGLNEDSTGMAFGPNGELYMYERSSQSLYSVNTNTAATTLIGFSGISAEDFTVSADGSEGFATAGGSLYSIDLVTGASTLIGALSGNTTDGLTTSASAVTIAGDMFAAGSVFGIDGTSLFSIDVLTGVTTLLGATSVSSEALSFDSTGTLFTHGNDGFLYTIDLSSLAGTQIGATSPSLVFGMAVQQDVVTSVSAPANLFVMTLVFGAIATTMRRQRKVTCKI